MPDGSGKGVIVLGVVLNRAKLEKKSSFGYTPFVLYVVSPGNLSPPITIQHQRQAGPSW